MLNPLLTFFRRPAAQHVHIPQVARTTAPEREPTSLEILQLIHDLRNQLMMMKLSGEETRDSSPEGRASRLDELEHSLERAVLLINALLLDEHPPLAARGAVDANEVVRRTTASLSDPSFNAIRVQLALWPEPLAVTAEAGDLDRVLLNLVLNAFDAMPEGGVLTIKTGIYHVHGSKASPSGQFARLTITDTGCGMTADVKERMFDAFFTTKKGGTGLGLRSVAFTVQQLKGRIMVETEPGRGTAVTVLLPLAPCGSILNFPASGSTPD